MPQETLAQGVLSETPTQGAFLKAPVQGVFPEVAGVQREWAVVSGTTFVIKGRSFFLVDGKLMTRKSELGMMIDHFEPDERGLLVVRAGSGKNRWIRVADHQLAQLINQPVTKTTYHGQREQIAARRSVAAQEKSSFDGTSIGLFFPESYAEGDAKLLTTAVSLNPKSDFGSKDNLRLIAESARFPAKVKIMRMDFQKRILQIKTLAPIKVVRGNGDVFKLARGSYLWGRFNDSNLDAVASGQGKGAGSDSLGGGGKNDEEKVDGAGGREKLAKVVLLAKGTALNPPSDTENRYFLDAPVEAMVIQNRTKGIDDVPYLELMEDAFVHDRQNDSHEVWKKGRRFNAYFSKK